jgi:hypothetical protein
MHLETRKACASLRKALPFTVSPIVQYEFHTEKKMQLMYSRQTFQKPTVLVSSPFTDIYFHTAYFYHF